MKMKIKSEKRISVKMPKKSRRVVVFKISRKRDKFKLIQLSSSSLSLLYICLPILLLILNISSILNITLADQQATSSISGSSSSSSTTTNSLNTKQQKSKTTLYACEETQLQIDCQNGESIQLIRANYGRFSIQTCNDLGHLDWSINCTSPASFQIIETSCQGKQACRLLASNSIFGDACPGTQKYLEVHYQCLPNGSTSKAQFSNTQQAAPFGQQGNINEGSSKQNVIANQLPQQQTNQDNPTNSETTQQEQFNGPPPTTLRGTPTAGQQTPIAVSSGDLIGQAQPAFPAWMPPLRAPPMIGPARELSFLASMNTQRAQGGYSTNSNSNNNIKCPEIVWRQVRWPQAEPGQTVRMPCPSHAQSGNVNDPFGATFVCLNGGQWSNRVQAARCQSIWLRNLTNQLEMGDSPLSALAELSQRTRVPIGQQFKATTTQSSNYLSSSLGLGLGLGLFGDDLIEIGRIVRKLVDEVGEFMARIVDEKQRDDFAIGLVQLLTDLVSNLSSEYHQDAWLDLNEIGGERQRVAAQLVQSLESASVLMAGLVQPFKLRHDEGMSSANEIFYAKQSEQAIVSIRPIQLPLRANETFTIDAGASNELGSILDRSNLIDSPEQRFTLRLQSNQVQQTATSSSNQDNDNNYNNNNNNPALKLVLITLKGIGHQMSPSAEFGLGSQQLNSLSNNRLMVNSNLFSLSIVADQRALKNSPIKVDLASPLELVFRHLEPLTWSVGNVQQQQQPRCVYWDSNISGWNSDGCKLMASNRTHSICGCNQLNTFALLTDLDQNENFNGFNHNHRHRSQQLEAQQDVSSGHFDFSNIQAKRPLESVENELVLPLTEATSNGNNNNNNNNVNSPTSSNLVGSSSKLLYLAKMLDGQVFVVGNSNGNSTGTNLHLLIHISCLVGAIVLIIHLTAALYNRIYSSRLLASIPSTAGPSMLVTSNNINSSEVLTEGQRVQGPSSLEGETSPSYTSSILDGNDYASAVCKAAHSIALEHNNRQSNTIWPQVLNGSSSCQQRTTTTNNNQNQNQNWLSSQPDFGCLFGVNYSNSAPNKRLNKVIKQSSYIDDYNNNLIINNQISSNELAFPIRLLIQMLAIQLLIVLLIECQNLFNSNRFEKNQYFMTTHEQQQQQQLAPIGSVSWFLIMLLCYLISSITCWLLSKFIDLSFILRKRKQQQQQQQQHDLNSLSFRSTCLFANEQNEQKPKTNASSTASSEASNSDQQSDKTTSHTISHYDNSSGRSMIQNIKEQTKSHQANRIYTIGCNNGNQNVVLNSPTPSASYSLIETHQLQHIGLGSSSDTPIGHGLVGVSQGGLFDNKRLRRGRRTTKTTTLNRDRTSLVETFKSDDIKEAARFSLVHLVPILLSLLLLWLSSGLRSLSGLSELVYVTSFAHQIASWPLLVEAALIQILVLLFIVPTFCLLILLALSYFVPFGSTARGSRGGGRRIMRNGRGKNQLEAQTNGQFNSIARSATKTTTNPYGPSALLEQHLSGHLAANSSLIHQNINLNGIVNGNSNSNNNNHSNDIETLNEITKLNSFKVGQQLNDHNGNQTVTSNKDRIVGSMLMRRRQHEIEFCLEEKSKWKRAKLVFILLSALWTLHSICWISFLVHIKLALTTNQIDNRQNSWTLNGSQLIYTFASSNLALVLLVSWCERQTLKRAVQVAGLARLRSLLSCGQQKHSNRHHHHHYDHHHHQQQQQQQQQQQHYNIGTFDAGSYQRQGQSVHYSSMSANNGNKLLSESTGPITKVSPSSNSLFLLSSGQQQQQQQQHHESAYGIGQHYSQQHLYQPVYGDSTMAMNEIMLGQQQSQQQAIQLMQQQHSFTMARSIQTNNNSNHLTSNGPMMTLDANGALKQQQQQFCSQASKTMNSQRSIGGQTFQIHSTTTNESDGPLVALSGSSNNSSRASNNNNNNNINNNELISAVGATSRGRTGQATFGHHQQSSTMGNNAIEHRVVGHHHHHHNHNHQQIQQQGFNPYDTAQLFEANNQENLELGASEPMRRDFRSVAGNSSGAMSMGNNQVGYPIRQQQQQQQQQQQSMHFRRASQQRSLMNYPSPSNQQQALSRFSNNNNKRFNVDNSECCDQLEDSIGHESGDNIYDTANNYTLVQ